MIYDNDVAAFSHIMGFKKYKKDQLVFGQGKTPSQSVLEDLYELNLDEVDEKGEYGVQ